MWAKNTQVHQNPSWSSKNCHDWWVKLVKSPTGISDRPRSFQIVGKSANPMKGLVSPSTPPPGDVPLKPPFSKAYQKKWCPSRLSPSPAALLHALPAAPCAPRCSLSKSSLSCWGFKGWLQGNHKFQGFWGNQWASLTIIDHFHLAPMTHMHSYASGFQQSPAEFRPWDPLAPTGPCSLCVWQCPRPQLAAVVQGAFLLQHFGGLCLCCLWGDRPGGLRTQRNEAAKRWIRWEQHNKH